jgi:hypothetical protein
MEIKSSGTFEEACQHQFELICSLAVGSTPTAHTAIAKLSGFKCVTCGASLYPLQGSSPVLGIAVPLTTAAPESKKPAAQAREPAKSTADPEKGLPGTEMMQLTAELGIVSPPGCGCKSRAAWMDSVGLETCRASAPDLRLMIRANWDKWGWKDKLSAVSASAWKAAGLGIDPRDPVTDLLEIAFDRAEEKMTAHNAKDQA